MSFSRRNFLRGASGVVLGLPFLEMLAPKVSAQAVTPPRVLILASGFSMDINHSYERETFSEGGPILQPLQRYSDRMTVVGGVNNLIAGLMSSNGHNASGKTLLASYPVKGYSPGITCTFDSEIAAPSIDHYLASRLGSPLLPLSVGGINVEHRLRWQQVGDSVVFDEGQTNPQTVFDNLFGSVTPNPGPVTPLQRIRAQRGSVLDAVLESLTSLHRRAGTADRYRLEQHADLIRAVERDVEEVVQVLTCDSPDLGVPGNWGTVQDNLLRGDGMYDDIILRVMGQLSNLSFACQASQVSSIHLRNMQSNTFPWLAGGAQFIPSNFHAVVHHETGTPQQRQAIYQWYARALGEILDMLDNTPDGPDTSLLDNTLVIWVSTLRHSSHSTDDLPVLLVGGQAQGTLIHKGTQDYIGQGGRSLGDLWTTVLRYAGVADNSFGWNTGVGSGGRTLNNGPLAELLLV